MEYFSGIATIQMIFARYLESYCQWYTSIIRETVFENVQRNRGQTTFFVLVYCLRSLVQNYALSVQGFSCYSIVV